MTSMTSDTSMSSARPLLRPLPPLPKITAVRRLAAALEELGHHPYAATAISLAVCDPSAVRRQLEQPGELRVAQGSLHVIHTSVWAPGVLPYPNNPRVLPAFAYAISGDNDRRTPLPRLGETGPSARELTTSVDRRELIGALDTGLAYLRDHNNLLESVAEYGVREPLTLVPLVIEPDPTSDAGEGVAVLAAVDGSSRTAAVYQLQGLEPAEVLLQLAGSGRLLRQRVQRDLALLDRDARELEEGDVARLRTLVVPAVLVLGFTPDPGVNAGLAAAVESRLGSLHVDPPKEWSAASKFDVQVDAVLQALVDSGELDEGEGEWLAGRLTPSEVVAAGLPAGEDTRAARLLELVHDRKRTVNAALRSLSTRRTRIFAADRVNVAVEAAIRPYRSSLPEVKVTAARNALQTAYGMQELQKPWSVHRSARRFGDVRIAALKEFQTSGQPGPLARELLVLGLYWLCRFGLIRKATRGGDIDRRSITDVLEEMVHTEHGILLLVRVVLDGRAGRTPRRVDPDGSLAAGPTGGDLPCDEAWIRKTWPGSSSSGGDEPTPGPEPIDSPEAVLARRRRELKQHVDELARAEKGLLAPVTDLGDPLIQTVGLPVSYVDEIVPVLSRVLARLTFYSDIAQQRGDGQSGDHELEETDD
ncbi:MAG: hypothetical protein M3O32_00740 [Actinomycetota bacterium]|nr:hypothetical protein [Actinomycetota bacterium]